MKQKGTPKRLPPKAQAAQWVAEDILNDDEIAAKVGISRTTLWRWKEKPEFKTAVQKIKDRFTDLCANNGLAKKEVRVNALRQRWVNIEDIKAERGASPEMANVPGGKTGMILKLYRQIGKESKEIFEYDAALAKEQRLIEDQIAIELGQRVNKSEITHKTFEGMSDEELELYASTGKLPDRIGPSESAQVM